MSAKKRRVFFFSMILIGAALILIYSGLTGNLNEKFTDIVVEFTAEDGSNKSAERTMFYLFSLFGVLAYFVCFMASRLGHQIDELKEWKSNRALIAVFAVSAVTNYVFYQTVNWFVIAAMLLTIIATLKNARLAPEAVAFMFLCIYGLVAIYRIAVFVGFKSPVDIRMIIAAAFVVSIVLLTFSDNNQLYLRGILILQLVIPFTLLVYISSAYKYGDDIVEISIPKRAILIIGIVIIGFIIEAAVRLKESIVAPSALNDVISYGTCVVIMAFNRFSGTGSIVNNDLHHPFENIIGYSQIFELGQKAFSEYLPVSGMYSIVQGWVFAFFGHGMASFYYLTQNLFYLGVLAIIVWLMRKQLKAEWVLFISIIFVAIDYNRIALIVPNILVLAWPKLIEKKNLWLKVWFLTSLVHGLYYPVFGAALMLGFLPMGIWQIYSYAKSGQLLADVKTVRFWIWWIICLLPAICSIGWLLGTLKHMLAMGAQTIYADGIARFGQLPDVNFMSYLNNMPLKLSIYYLLSYLILIMLVWLSVALFLQIGKVRIENKKLIIENQSQAFLALSLSIILLVSFSYTVVRFDYFDIYSRSFGVVSAAFVVLVMLVANQLKQNNGNALIVLVFAVFIISVVSGEGFMAASKDSKLEAYYTVPEEYVYVNDAEPRFGEAFVSEDTYDYVTRINNSVNTIWGRDNTYFGIVDSFGLYYLCNIRGDSVMEILNTIKGYTAVEESVQLITENDSVVGLNVNPVRNYYLYHWLLASGEYIFNNDLRVFVPNDGSVSDEAVRENNKAIDMPLAYLAEDVGSVAGSFGSSMDELSDIFSETNVDYAVNADVDGAQVDFTEAIDGDEADFIYLELADIDAEDSYVLLDYHMPVEQNAADYGIFKSLLKKENNVGYAVTLSWTGDDGEEHSMKCDYDEGKLLIPLGSGSRWLLNKHTQLNITFGKDGELLPMPEIKELKMLKVREIE